MSYDLLLGELKGFKESAEIQFNLIRSDIKELRKEERKTAKIQWKFAGIMIGVSVVVTGLGNLLIIYIRTK